MTGHAGGSKKPSFWSFFTTLPGILAGLAGLLTAVGAVAALFITSDSPSAANPADSSRARSSARTSPPSTHTPADGNSAFVGGSGATASGNANSGAASSRGGASGAAGSRGGVSSPAGSSGGRASSGGRGTGSTANSNTAPTAGFRVIETILRADPFRGSVSCPVQIRFSGRISVAGGSGTVTYRWIRSDGASAPVQTLSFEGPSSKDIETPWTRWGDPGAEIAGWQAIEIIEPHASSSRRASFDLVCG